MAVGFGTGGYTVPRFPPITCLAMNPDAAFYSLILPVTVFVAAGISLVIGIFFHLCGKNTNQATHPENAEENVRVGFGWFLYIHKVQYCFVKKH